MKARINRDLVAFFILITLFLGLAFYLSNSRGSKEPDYTVGNKTRTGLSIFFETLKELRYPVERTIEPIEEQNTDSIQIVVSGGNFDVNDSRIKEWVAQGGTLIYLVEGGYGYVGYGEPEDTAPGLVEYSYEKGNVIMSDVRKLANSAIIKDKDYAYELLMSMKIQNHGALYFNERHFTVQAEEKSLWGYMTMEDKFIVYQLLLALMAFFIFKGRRFGKPIPLYDEVERDGNEYLYSVSALYRHAKCWNLIVENYYKSFLREINSSHDDWLELWQRQELPNLAGARKVYEFMHRPAGKVKAKEYIQVLTALEQLKNILSKRRDSYWKALKRTM
ncbi:MAG: DUF4350 domain-containing protein [Bacillota bacterium]|nr:DUF4350 domain-containing protein [Bacillota bacterium]